MTWERDRIAQLIKSAPPGARVQIVVNIDPENPAQNGHKPRSMANGHTTTGTSSRNPPRLSTSALLRWLEREIAERPALDFGYYILSSAEVSRRIIRAGYAPVRGKAIHSLLKAGGFVKFKTLNGPNGPANYWSLYPELFCDENGEVIPARVRDHLIPL